MKKTLYISDLDGTLLNDDEKINARSVQMINGLIDQGLHFTVATARSLESARQIIAPLHLEIPVIFHNGTFIYDPMQKEYIVSHFLPNVSAEQIIEKFESNGTPPFVHAINENGEAKIYYKGIFHRGQEEYVQNRLKKGDRRFVLVDDFSACHGKRLIAIVVIGDEHMLGPLFQNLKEHFDLAFHFSEDHYTKAHWLEVSHPEATKKSAVQFLKDHLKVDRLVCFGDNLNDLSMFEAADEGYAVANGKPEVREAATRVIGDHNEDGVADFLQSEFKMKAGRMI